MPTELELIALETEFDLYLSFTKRLVLNLPDSDDRTRAAIWLQKLRSIDDDDHKKLRNEHLKLLLFALHRRSLLGVFEKPPHEELESFHDGLTLLEMTRELIELTEKKQASGDNSGESPLPPVTTNVSADLKEYCASQSIPKFGAHVYYAVSNEPIQMWSKSPNCVYPASSDVPNPLQWELTLSKLTDHVLEKQAEAERLAAEAAHDDKTEEKDNTQILPSIDVAVCAGAGNSVFKWKADSILTLHQNYDFSDVGVAEDLEVQGKWQLELDEMAFSILDHSLPGRQKVVVRDPFYQGLPPDIAERRNHGVIDEVELETSSSSSGIESIDGLGEAGREVLNFESSEADGIEKSKCKCCGKGKKLNKKSSNEVEIDTLSFFPFFPRTSGKLAKKYLKSSKNLFDLGLHSNPRTGKVSVGSFPADIEGDDILIDYGKGDIVRYKGTEGIWRLLTQDQSYFDQDDYYTDNDWVMYMEIIMRSNVELLRDIEMGNPEKLMEKTQIAKFDWSDWGDWGEWGWDRYLPEVSKPGLPDYNKITKWGVSKIPSVPKFNLGLFWPEFTLGVPNLGLSMDLIETIPGLKYLKFWEWFQAPEVVYVKELDDLLRKFISRLNSAKGKEADKREPRVFLAIGMIERIVALVGKPGGWAKFIMWSLCNKVLLQFSRFSNYLLNDINTEIHIPGTNFCGPGTQLYERLKAGQKGKHPIDEACGVHDMFYRVHRGAGERMKADLKLGLYSLWRLFSLNASLKERFAGVIIVQGMSLKVIVEYLINFMIWYLQVDVNQLDNESKS